MAVGHRRDGAARAVMGASFMMSSMLKMNE
jgi:hypothetical protein